jgi:hypothetical protein
MTRPSLRFLCDCIAEALLAHYGVSKLPVPVRRFLTAPPPDLADDLGLADVLPYGDALWLRLPGGGGSVFANPEVSLAEQRYGMARALFTGVCASQNGREAGLPSVPNDGLTAQADLFARRLLMPPSLLPAGWENMPAERLAERCGVPTAVAAAQLREANRVPHAAQAEQALPGQARGPAPTRGR